MVMGNEKYAQNLLRAGKKVLAAWGQAASGITTEIMAASGYDVVVIDLEHGPGDIKDLIWQVQSMQAHKAVPFARVPWNDPVWIKRILDAGVYGIHVPYVNTASEAEAAVSAVRYPSRGTRGIAGSPRGSRYGINTAEHLKHFDKDITLIIAIESQEGIDNLDEILKVEGIDVLFIGPMDLATNLGYFADPSHPDVQKEIMKIEKKVLAAGLSLGSVASSWEDAKEKFDRGYNYLISLSDTGTLAKAGAEQISQFKKHFPRPRD
jgi:2-keto-3-deoxy-L-rhamnonate aldolase RhmA